MEDPGIYIYIHGFCQFQNFASFQFLNSKQHISNCNKSNSFEPYLVPQCPRQKKQLAIATVELPTFERHGPSINLGPG
jgi:hypothetical protein